MTDRIIPKCPIYIKDYSLANWSDFRNQTNNDLAVINIPSNRNLSIDEIDSFVLCLTQKIQSADSDHIPLREINSNNFVMNNDLVKIIKHKNKIRRRIFLNPLAHNTQNLKSQVKCLNKIIHDQISTLRDSYLQNRLNIIKKDRNVFQNINRISNRKPFAEIPDLYESTPTSANTNDIRMVSNPSEKTNLLGKYFEKVHKKNDHLGNPQITSEINNNISNLLKCDFENIHPIYNFCDAFNSNGSHNFEQSAFLTRPTEIKKIIKSLKNKKSFGYDNISNYLIKKLSNNFHNVLTIIINNCINTGYYPKTWKTAKILPFLKHGKDPSFPISYRPISLLSCISKIYDIENAFDRVWIEGFVHKLKFIFNFPDFLNKILYNYLIERSFFVTILNSITGDIVKSNEYKISAGTAQGSILAPILYNLYLSDIQSSSSDL